MKSMLESIPLDQSTLTPNSLNVAKRTRTNLFPWTGQFQPQFIEELMSAYSIKSGTVLDPFVGSGTVLVEAARANMSALGVELNPSATIFSSFYKFINLDIRTRKMIFTRWRNLLHGEIKLNFRHVGYSSNTICQDLEKILVDLWQKSNSGYLKTLTSTLIIFCDFYKKDISLDKIQKISERLEHILYSLPQSKLPIIIKQADARCLPFYADSTDLIITSPPYINVHNYHQNFRRSAEAMGHNILNLARSEIGSNRQNRSNRFLTVIQYALDMTLAMHEMARVTKHNGKIILVVGRESTVLGERFLNSSLVAEIGTKCIGFKLDKRQERVFQNRYGKNIYEDIIHFRPIIKDTQNKEDCLSCTRTIVNKTLNNSLQIASKDTTELLESAISKINDMAPSPILTSNNFKTVGVS